MSDVGKKKAGPGAQNLLTPIGSLTAHQKGVNVQFIVLETGAGKRTAEGGEVRTVRVADHSGSVDMGVWDEVGAALRPSFICRLRNGFVSVRHGALSLSVGKHGELTKIGEITMLYSDTPNMSAFNPELAALESGGGGGQGRKRDAARDPAQPHDPADGPSEPKAPRPASQPPVAQPRPGPNSANQRASNPAGVHRQRVF